MSLLLELNVHSEQLEETLDTLASLPFDISPKLRAAGSGKRTTIEFLANGLSNISQIENALRARGSRGLQNRDRQGAEKAKRESPLRHRRGSARIYRFLENALAP
jgi:hypothetical protein